MLVQFNTPHQYLFYHQNVKHLFLLWKKEQRRELYIVDEEGDQLLLTYPGEIYIDTVLHEIEPIFFQKLMDEASAFPVVLGATFYHRDQLYGMYYTPPQPAEPLYFFKIKKETILEIPDAEYRDVVHAFTQEFKEYVSI